MRTILLSALFFVPAAQAQETDLAAKALPDKVTFAEHIAALIHNNCTSCHRPGQAGPFELRTYRDVKKRARMLRRVMKSRYMPPWPPVEGHGEFLHTRRLSDRQIALFDKWVEQGRPEGDPSKTPPAPVFKDGWALGKPDLVVEMKEGFSVPADGPDVYRSFVFPINLPEDKWVAAMELRPSARSVVHHALFFLVDSGEARSMKSRDGRPGVRGMRSRIRGGLGGYVPGVTPVRSPRGLARRLPKGTDLVMQTHFHPSGKAEVEKSKIGLYFTDQPPEKQMVSIQLPPLFGARAGIDIPAGKKDYKIEDRFELPVDVTAQMVSSHAHYICKSMKLTAKLPSGQTRSLLYIDNWDLDWQGRYWFKEPFTLPKGTVIHSEIVYDNSAENPANPYSPPRRIRWGRESTDEMGSITLRVTTENERVYRTLRSATRRKQASSLLGGRRRGRRGGRGEAGNGGLAAWVRRQDKNGDGKLTKDEIPERFRARLMRLDRNGDGVIDRKELEVLRGR